jgi:hypothetical protein
MNLKQAREKGKMEQFINEHEGKYPPANKKRLQRLIKSMAVGTAKPNLETLRKGSRGS